MAINVETLAALGGQAYGPVTFEQTEGSLRASFRGEVVALAMDGMTVRLRSTAAVPWPAGGDAAEVDRRISRALASIASVRPELVTIEGDRGSATTTVTLWLDAATATTAELATAARTVVLLGDVAWQTVDQVGAQVNAEARLVEAQVEAERQIVEAEAMIERFEALPEDAGPAPVVEPAPPRPTTKASSREARSEPAASLPPAPTTADPPVAQHCSACGAALKPEHRFCMACGEAVEGA